MKVKIPEKIFSLTHPYRIKFQRRLWMEENTQGYINHTTQIIGIEPECPPSQRDVTLIHEVIESVNRHTRCGLDDTQIDRVAHGIAEFFFSNLGIEFDWSDITEVNDKQ